MAGSRVSNIRRIAYASTALAGSLTLNACLGSGSTQAGIGIVIPGDGFRSGGGGLPIADYEADPEYQAMSALSLIGASTYYNGGSNPNGYTGSGVTVAIIDTGIDYDHPEFAGGLDPTSTSVVSASLDDVTGHGTWVAGVVGANRNSIGMHGVAFNSTILAIRAEVCFGGLCGFLSEDLVEATNYAVQRGADIINLSLGGPAADTDLRLALINAVNNDTVIVAAAGNDYDPAFPADALDPLYPAIHAIEAAFNGQMIAAGAYDEGTGDIADFSNRAGVAADFYLMAPGVDIYTTDVGGGYTTVSGTSFAAPIISGAVALLKERFPALTADQIVDILLVSATDLGAAGTDAIYGRGLLNLAAAALPLGTLTIPSTASVDGGGSDPENTTLMLSAAFGDALGGSGVLADTMFLDGYGRDYGIDLTASIATASSGPDLLGFLTGGDAELYETTLSSDTRIRLRRTAAGEGPERWRDATFDEEPSDASFSVRHRIAEGAELTIAQGQGAGGQFGLYGIGAPAGSGMLGTGDVAFIGMADAGGNATLSTALGGGLRFRVGMGVNEETLDDEIEGSADDASVYVAEMSHAGKSGTRLGVRFGRLIEDGSLLETGGDGGFALGGSATTDFVSAFGVVPLTEHIDLYGSYTTGQSDAESLTTDLIGDFDGMRSESLSLGIGARNLFADQDRLAFTLVRPLRVTGGTATVTAPVSRTLDGVVNYQEETIGLTPSGRETDAEVTYAFTLGPNEQLDFSVVTRFEPDHVQDAAPEYSAGVRYRLKF